MTPSTVMTHPTERPRPVPLDAESDRGKSEAALFERLLAAAAAPSLRALCAEHAGRATRLAQGLASCLAARLDVPFQIAPARGTEEPPDISFGLELGPHAFVGLDVRAARACVDALAVRLGGLRGSGELTSVDQGLLEALSLEALHRMHGADDELPDLTAFARRGQAERWIARGDSSRIDFVLRCAGREGRLWVWLGEASNRIALAFPPATDARPETARITLRLPPVPLTPEEVSSLQPGDVVLLGLAELVGAARCEIVCRQGWRLAEARVVGDSATATTVACGPLELGDPTPAETAGVEVTLGDAVLRSDHLDRWGPEPPLLFDKTTDGAARVHVSPRSAFRAELVKLDGQLGARLLEEDVR